MFRAGLPLPVSHGDVQMSSKSLSATPSPLAGPPLCEDGRPYVTDPLTGRQVCLCNLGVDSPPYGPRPTAADALKSGALVAGVGASALGLDPSVLYPPLVRGMPLRPDRLPPYLTSCLPGQPPMPFDPVLAAHPYGLLYAGLDMAGSPMRKAATRETTGPLKAWLSEHKKNPYPTKAEKIMLAIITRMTLTQVSTWFANARRRLKKENKLFPGDRDDKDDDDEDDDTHPRDDGESGSEALSLSGTKKLGLDSDNEDINVESSDISDDEDCKPSLAHLGHTHLGHAHLGIPSHRKSGFSSDQRSREETELLHSRDRKFGHAAFKTDAKETSRKPQEDSVVFEDGKSAVKDKPHFTADLKDSRNVSPASTSQDILKRQGSLSAKPRIWSISEIIDSPSTPSSDSEKLTHGDLAAFYERSRFSFPPHHLTRNPIKFPFPSPNSSHSPPTPPLGDTRPDVPGISFAHPSHQASLLSSFKQYVESNSELRHHPMLGCNVSDLPLALLNPHKQASESRLPSQIKAAHRGYPFPTSTPKTYEAVRGWMAKNEDYINRHRNVLSPNSDTSQDLEKREELLHKAASRSRSPLVKSKTSEEDIASQIKEEHFGRNLSKSPTFWRNPSKSPSFGRHPSKSPDIPLQIPTSNGNLDLSRAGGDKLRSINSPILKSPSTRTLKSFPDSMSSSHSSATDDKTLTSTHRV